MISVADNNIRVDRGKGLSAESVSGKLRQPFLGGMLYVIYNIYEACYFPWGWNWPALLLVEPGNGCALVAAGLRFL